MLSNDVDINILHLKLNALEERVKVLEGNNSIKKKPWLPQWEEGLVKQFNERPPQWPNESHTDYLKRIGKYNEAQGEGV